MSITSERSQVVFQRTEQALLKLSSSQQPEDVHRFRTTTRRLQTLLEEFIPERSRNQKKLLRLLGQLRKRAGKVRDLDAQLVALRSLRIPQEPRRKTQLTQDLIELRAKHEHKLCKMLNKSMIHDVRKRLKRAANEARPEAGRDPLVIAKQIVAQVQHPAEQLTEDVLHQFRTVVKRARYAAELAPKSAEGTKFIAELKRLQDAIGNWHDWLTLTDSAGKRLGEVNQSSLVAALHNVTRGKFRHAVAALSTSRAVHTSLKPVASMEHSHKLDMKNPVLVTRIDSAA